MSAEQNKATVSRFYEEVWNKGNAEFAYEVFAEDYNCHDHHRDDLGLREQLGAPIYAGSSG